MPANLHKNSFDVQYLKCKRNVSTICINENNVFSENFSLLQCFELEYGICENRYYQDQIIW